jgi:hypothetical protein
MLISLGVNLNLGLIDVLPVVNGGDSSSAAHAALRWLLVPRRLPQGVV